MARYRLTKDAYINEALHAAGDVVTVADDFPAGPHMEPYVDPDGKEDAAARKAKDAAAEKQMPAPGDPEYIGAMIAHTVGDGSTMGRVSVASAHPQVPGAPGVVVDGDGHVRGVMAGVAEPVQAPYARLPGASETEMEQAVADDAAARDGKGPVAEEAAAATKRRRGE